eukprot:Gb_39034 [translate_table: standard]
MAEMRNLGRVFVVLLIIHNGVMWQTNALFISDDVQRYLCPQSNSFIQTPVRRTASGLLVGTCTLYAMVAMFWVLFAYFSSKTMPAIDYSADDNIICSPRIRSHNHMSSP